MTCSILEKNEKTIAKNKLRIIAIINPERPSEIVITVAKIKTLPFDHNDEITSDGIGIR